MKVIGDMFEILKSIKISPVDWWKNKKKGEMYCEFRSNLFTHNSHPIV